MGEEQVIEDWMKGIPGYKVLRSAAEAQIRALEKVDSGYDEMGYLVETISMQGVEVATPFFSPPAVK